MVSMASTSLQMHKYRIIIVGYLEFRLFFLYLQEIIQTMSSGLHLSHDGQQINCFWQFIFSLFDSSPYKRLFA